MNNLTPRGEAVLTTFGAIATAGAIWFVMSALWFILGGI